MCVRVCVRGEGVVIPKPLFVQGTENGRDWFFITVIGIAFSSFFFSFLSHFLNCLVSRDARAHRRDSLKYFSYFF